MLTRKNPYDSAAVYIEYDQKGVNVTEWDKDKNPVKIDLGTKVSDIMKKILADPDVVSEINTKFPDLRKLENENGTVLPLKEFGQITSLFPIIIRKNPMNYASYPQCDA